MLLLDCKVVVVEGIRDAGEANVVYRISTGEMLDRKDYRLLLYILKRYSYG